LAYESFSDISDEEFRIFAAKVVEADQIAGQIIQCIQKQFSG